MKKANDSYDFKAIFEQLINMEHFRALVSDGFWYYICQEFKDTAQYEAHCEFLLDRMAANFVSYQLAEAPELHVEGKRKYFAKLYNHLAQAIYHALKLAFPKTGNVICTDTTKRKLLNTFSLLFTGVTVHSAMFSNWSDQRESGAPDEVDKNLTLADVKRPEGGGPIKSKRQQVTLRHSTLVERYLKTHKYETFNNLKGWRMMLTQQTDTQRDINLKFKQYLQIADKIKKETQQMQSEYSHLKASLDHQMVLNERKAKRHIKTLKESLAEKKNNGGCAEYANMLVSIFNSEHLNNENK